MATAVSSRATISAVSAESHQATVFVISTAPQPHRPRSQITGQKTPERFGISVRTLTPSPARKLEP